MYTYEIHVVKCVQVMTFILSTESKLSMSKMFAVSTMHTQDMVMYELYKNYHN